MTRNLSLCFLLSLVTFSALYAQTPVIQKVEPLIAHPNDTILITGSGFSAAANMDVWFEQVEGTIITSSEFAIEVRVPPQARMGNIEVINRTSGLSARSNLKFTPSFSGEPFNVANFNTTLVEGVNKFTAAEELWDLSTADLNSDGKPDVVATKFSTPTAFFGPSTDLMILQNQSTPGNLAFTKLDKTNLPVLNFSFPTDNVVLGDLQGDGKPEIIVSRAGSTRNSIHILRNTSPAGGAISFAAFITLPLDVTHVAARIAIRDLNKDGKPDLVVTNTFNDIVYIFVNSSSGGTLSFSPTPVKVSVRVFATDASTTNYEAEVQDFNGDDLPDMVVNEFQDDSLHIFTNTSAGTISFSSRVTIPTADRLNRLNSADINKDGKPDLIATSTLNNRLLVFLNQTTGSTITFGPAMTLGTSTGAWGVDVGDIDGDHDPDLINVNRAQNIINVFRHNGNFATPGFARVDITTTTASRNVKVADMDGDGKPDIVHTSFNLAASPNTSSLEILRNTNCHRAEILNDKPIVMCNGQKLILETYPASNVIFTWTKNGLPIGINSPYLTLHSPGAVGAYTVTATGESGTCVSTTPVLNITEDTGAAPANPAITANTPLCSGGILNLSTPAVAGATYTWTGPNNFTSTSQTPTINAVTQDHAGMYELQVMVGVCKSNVTTKRVDVADLADFSITSNNPTNTICLGGTLTLSVSNLANHCYQWKKDGVNIGTCGASATLNVTQEGNYSVDITNTILNCNKEVGPVTVNVLSVPVAAYQVDATACVGEAITFTNQSTTDPAATPVYNWNFGDASSSNSTSPTKTYSTNQVFNTSLTVSYSGVAGCSDVENKPVTIISSVKPVIATTAPSLCPDEEATLSITGTFPTIAWSNGAATASTTVTGPATYTVSTTDMNGCAAEDDIVISARALPELSVSATPVKIPLGATSQLLAEGNADTYLWAPGETLSSTTIPNPVATPINTTTYTVTATITNGCSVTQEIVVTVAGILGFPVAFSPNGDGINDEWVVGAVERPDCSLNVFDVRGRRVFEGKGRNWDGTSQGGQAVPDGTYYYVFGCPSEKPITGNVLIIR
jgi:gliding motility-associated-like protein